METLKLQIGLLIGSLILGALITGSVVNGVSKTIETNNNRLNNVYDMMEGSYNVK